MARPTLSDLQNMKPDGDLQSFYLWDECYAEVTTDDRGFVLFDSQPAKYQCVGVFPRTQEGMERLIAAVASWA